MKSLKKILFMSTVTAVGMFSLYAMLVPVPQNYKNFRQVLNNHFHVSNSKSSFIITVSRENFDDPNRQCQTMKNHTVSHDELKQILKLIYALCGMRIEGRNIPNYRVGGVALNIQPYAQRLKFHPDCLKRVDDTCKAIEKFSKDNDMHNSCKIIVFDEMFFGQMYPLTSMEKNFIKDRILDISNNDDRAFFYTNFLYLENRNTNGINMRNAYRHMKRMRRQGIMNIDDDCFSDLRDIIMRTPYNAVPIQRNYLINETYCINNGNILTRYKKASYFHESDDEVANGAVYDFGNGEDEILSRNPIANILINRVSTEICLDLNCGIRHANGWRNSISGAVQSSDVHIVQSNIINPFDNDNILKLPQQPAEIIIHADAHYRRNLSIVSNGIRHDIACATRRFCVTIGRGRYAISIMKI